MAVGGSSWGHWGLADGEWRGRPSDMGPRRPHPAHNIDRPTPPQVPVCLGSPGRCLSPHSPLTATGRTPPTSSTTAAAASPRYHRRARRIRCPGGGASTTGTGGRGGVKFRSSASTSRAVRWGQSSAGPWRWSVASPGLLAMPVRLCTSE